MYNVQPTAHHGSADSLASESEDPSLQVEDHGHSTTMATISGKQSISKAISQRLSRTRTRSRDVLTATRGNGNVVIGIAVQEATIEHHAEEIETPHETVVKSTVEVPQGVKRQRSAPKLDGNGNGNGSSAGGQLNWMSKAKELTTRFKRRSMAALSQIS
ncbi:hypothetical protein BXZ70DRAFT_735230 [Cristinia sonorae]|uniref:Uncharacterized protein n=1 Tax=Cristinia sonorae TaxID=1940300 RepID=A0A8K0UT64_9AGAR|nr:hypothetical protein BXZ70DRAFT_735230 [Cristinia sonorae]